MTDLPLEPADGWGSLYLAGEWITAGERDTITDEKIIAYVEDSFDEGATLETGGEADGLVVEPTVLSGADNGMSASCNEHFCPVAPVIPYSSPTPPSAG